MYVKKEVIESVIINSGSDSENIFGYPEIENGLYLQQDSREFAEFIFFMMTKIPPSELSIDIGLASGGSTKLLRDYYQCKKTIVVDSGQHPKFKHWERIKKTVKSELILELIMNSHSNEVKRQLMKFKGQIDFAFIDGDHTYDGLKQDIELIREIAKPGCIFVLHDTNNYMECRYVALELLKDNGIRLIRNIEIKYGISVWKII